MLWTYFGLNQEEVHLRAKKLKGWNVLTLISISILIRFTLINLWVGGIVRVWRGSMGVNG